MKMKSQRRIIVAAAAALITLTLSFHSIGATPERVDLLIRGGTILTMDSQDRVIENGALAVRGDTIIAVGDSAELSRRYTARRVIYATGKAVLPGLINTHTHAPMTLFRGIADDLDLQEWLTKYIFPAEKKNVTRDFVYWGMMLACLEMIQSGTTTFADMYYFEDAVAEAAAKAGMRAVPGETILDFPSPDSPTVAEALAYTKRFIEKWRNHPLITPAVAPHAAYTCSTDTLLGAKKLADEYGVPLLIHLSETQPEVEEIKKKYNATPVEYLERIGFLSERVLAAHVVHVNESEIATLKKRNVGAAHNPQSNMKLASGAAPVVQMLAAGLALGLGTDGAASNNNLDMFTEMKVATLLQKHLSRDPRALSARDVLRMATINGARALDKEKDIGSLEAGKKADLIIVKLDSPHQIPLYDVGSQLVYATKSSDVETAIINGKVVMSARRVLTLNEPLIRRRVEALTERIKQSLRQ
jgi:5-methylthioadenosine/S-adenosylhomocysteine deaminase